MKRYQKLGLKNPAIIVDTNHANSNKEYLEQIRIAKDVLHSIRRSDDIKNMVKGLMIESYIEDGAQKIGEGHYGMSITDPCLGWEKTKASDIIGNLYTDNFINLTHITLVLKKFKTFLRIGQKHSGDSVLCTVVCYNIVDVYSVG